jgi:hypothetical protein
MEEGQLLPNEIGPSIKRTAAAMQVSRAKNDRDMKQAEDRIQRRMMPVMPLAAYHVCVAWLPIRSMHTCLFAAYHAAEVDAAILNGAAIFFEDSVASTSQGVLTRLREHRAHVVQSRLLAGCVVTVDPVNAGQRCSWIAALLGLAVVSLRMFIAGHGPAIQYAAAVKTQRSMFLTADFQHSHPVLSTIIVKCAAKPLSRWRLAAASTPGCLQLVTDVQDTSVAGVIGPTRFLALCKCPVATSMGACGV